MSKHSLIVVIGAAVWLLSGGAVWADLWYEHYAAAEQALADQRWTEAVAECNQALEKRGDSGARVRTYGMKFTAYFPYLKLGIAYYHLGQLEAALQAFETEERLGAIAESHSAKLELQKFRNLASEAQSAAQVSERERIQSIVNNGLNRAKRLEAEGQLEEAVAALGQALAVAPQDPDALEAQGRLRGKLAQRDQQQQRIERAASLRERGRELIEQGQFSEASSVLRQAQALTPSDEIDALLAQAQQRLRSQLQAESKRQGAALAERRFDEAKELQRAGRREEALERLQSVLAVEPSNRAALTLQERLVAEQAAAEGERQRRETVDKLLARGGADLSANRFEATLATANQVLALDEGNPTAVEQLARAYQAINRRLLGGAVKQNFPPAIRFVDLRSELKDGSLVQTVASPEFVLRGVVIDDSPVQLQFYGSGAEPLVGQANSQQAGDVYITEFQLAHSLGLGLTDLRLVATDAEQVSSTSEYRVLYRRPLSRSPWLYGAVFAAALLSGGALLGWQLRRRRALRRRRFNPFMAGAPVLDAKLFFGRQQLLDRILQTLHNNSLLLYGERRIGKTTLQHQLKRRLQELQDPDYDFHSVYIDLQGTPEQRFFAHLAEEIFQELGPILDGFEPCAALDDRYGYREFVRDIRAVLKGLQAKSQKQLRLVLLIDEVDELNAYDPKVNQKLRSLFMKNFAENLVAVVSGVSIKRDWEREGSPWYNFFEEIEVQPFHPEDARELIERPIQGVFTFEPGVVERITALTECRPYQIQRFCIRLVHRMYEANRRRITVADVEAVHALAGAEPS